jgi:amino-acid N-acetyltransferase
MTGQMASGGQQGFVAWFRAAAPYIRAHRGQTFVIGFGGGMVEAPGFPAFLHDVALLSCLGVKIVLVHGIRVQLERLLAAHGVESRFAHGARVTDDAALAQVKAACGAVRVEIEALLSMGLANSPMAGARIRVASGNFITARPVGVRDGVDYLHTGEIRRVDGEAIAARLQAGDICLLSPMGYSPTGEVFKLTMPEVACAVAAGMEAGKLIYFLEGPGPLDEAGRVRRELTEAEARRLLAAGPSPDGGVLVEALPGQALPVELAFAARATAAGVSRTHLIPWGVDGGLLIELFSRDGLGTMISRSPFDLMRPASIEDVGGILELIAPLEAEGTLVRRSRDQIEMEIGDFTVLVRDGAVIACAALHPFTSDGVAEISCLAVHGDYRRRGFGDALLARVEQSAREQGLNQIFLLTTRAGQWYQERGYREGKIQELPVQRQRLYNFQRNSKVFLKDTALVPSA